MHADHRAAPPKAVNRGAAAPSPADLPTSTHQLIQASLAALETFVREETAADRFSGAVLVAKDGDMLFSKAYGLADREQEIPNTVHTRFRVGSMNKMFTAVAILQLVEARKVALEAPSARTSPTTPTGRSPSRSRSTSCLTHTGGTGDIFGAEFSLHREDLRTLDDYVELYGRRGPEFELARVVVQQLRLHPARRRGRGGDRTELLRLCARAHLRAGRDDRTGSLPEAKEVPDRAIGYMDLGGGTDWQPNTDTLPYRGTSAGGGYSTVEDFKRFAEALLDDELLNRAQRSC